LFKPFTLNPKGDGEGRDRHNLHGVETDGDVIVAKEGKWDVN
jgi:hypothetical protein